MEKNFTLGFGNQESHIPQSHHDDDENDAVDVDTTLTLSLPGSSSKKKSTITSDDEVGTSAVIKIFGVVCKSTPLPRFWPTFDSSTARDQNQVDTSTSAVSTISHPTPLRCFLPGADTKKRKGRGKDGGHQRPKRRRNAENHQQPLVPIEEIPRLIQTLRSRGGSGAVFLYRKRLEQSDVERGQNRLFVTRGERVMEFLKEEEAAEVNSGRKGMKIVGIDGGGAVYNKIGLTRWTSVKMIVINSQWMRVVAQNNAKAGDVVEIWGYRENHKPCLAFNFR